LELPGRPTGGINREIIESQILTGAPPEALMRLLVWLSPLTVRRKQPAAIELTEGS
jgi:hypothetical protein